MESDFPAQIDDSLPFEKQPVRQEREEEQYYEPPPPQYFAPPPQWMHQHPPPVQEEKKGDIFSDLGRIHWIIFVSAILLAFFIGKSMSTPVILRAS
jgi:hypothetical protein